MRVETIFLSASLSLCLSLSVSLSLSLSLYLSIYPYIYTYIPLYVYPTICEYQSGLIYIYTDHSPRQILDTKVGLAEKQAAVIQRM